jgi:hypothetical protein
VSKTARVCAGNHHNPRCVRTPSSSRALGRAPWIGLEGVNRYGSLSVFAPVVANIIVWISRAEVWRGGFRLNISVPASVRSVATCFPLRWGKSVPAALTLCLMLLLRQRVVLMIFDN